MNHRVILCAPDNSSFSPGITRALDYISCNVVFFDFRRKTIVEKISGILPIKIQKNIGNVNTRLIKIAEKTRPDVVLVLKGESINGLTIDTLKRMGIKVVNWFPDHVGAFGLALKLSEYYDYFFHFDPLAISQLKKEGRKNICYLPFAADILPSDKRPSKRKKKFEISFIGNYDSYREKYLKSVSNLGLNIWGDKRWAKSSLSSCYMGNQLPNSKFSEISRSSKININIQHEYPCEGLVLRPFEVLGSGAFLLTESKKDVRRLFNNDVAIFNSPEDLRRKVIYFLGHDKKRESFAEKGYSEVKSRHTYIHRLKNIFKVLLLSDEKEDEYKT